MIRFLPRKIQKKLVLLGHAKPLKNREFFALVAAATSCDNCMLYFSFRNRPSNRKDNEFKSYASNFS